MRQGCEPGFRIARQRVPAKCTEPCIRSDGEKRAYRIQGLRLDRRAQMEFEQEQIKVEHYGGNDRHRPSRAILACQEKREKNRYGEMIFMHASAPDHIRPKSKHG